MERPRLNGFSIPHFLQDRRLRFRSACYLVLLRSRAAAAQFGRFDKPTQAVISSTWRSLLSVDGYCQLSLRRENVVSQICHPLSALIHVPHFDVREGENN